MANTLRSVATLGRHTSITDMLCHYSNDCVHAMRRCGCDYVNNIRGVGPVKALTLIQKHGNIEGVLEHLDLTKYPLPEPFPFKVGGWLW